MCKGKAGKNLGSTKRGKWAGTLVRSVGFRLGNVLRDHSKELVVVKGQKKEVTDVGTGKKEAGL